jgi:hypothetical protein
MHAGGSATAVPATSKLLVHHTPQRSSVVPLLHDLIEAVIVIARIICRGFIVDRKPNDRGNTSTKAQLNLCAARFPRCANYRFNVTLSYYCRSTAHISSLNQQISV